MRKIFFVFIFMIFSGKIFAQDSIRLYQTWLVCKVKEIKEDKITYIPYNDTDTALHSIKRWEVQFIKFENGRYEKFTEFKNYARHAVVLKIDPFSPLRSKFGFGLEYSLHETVNLEMWAHLISSKAFPFGVLKNETRKSGVMGFEMRGGLKFHIRTAIDADPETRIHPVKSHFIRTDISYMHFAITPCYFESAAAFGASGYSSGNYTVDGVYLGVSYGQQFLLGKSFTFQYTLGFSLGNYRGNFSGNPVNYTETSRDYFWVRTGHGVYDEAPNFSLLTDRIIGKNIYGLTGSFCFGYILPSKKRKR